MDLLCWGQLRQLYSDHSLDKQGRDSRMFQIRDDVITKIRALKPGWDPTVLNDVFSAVSRDAVRSLIFEENIRVDGRWVANGEQFFSSYNCESRPAPFWRIWTASFWRPWLRNNLVG